MIVKITIHALESGKCALTGKDTEGVRVSFDDGSFTEVFLSHKAFQKIYAMKAKQDAPRAKTTMPPVAATPITNAVQK
jgi:hypothetical protein